MLSKIEIDRENDLAYISLQPELASIPGAVAKSTRLADDLIADFDGNGQIIGIELLNASARLNLDAVKEQVADAIVGVKEAAELAKVEKSNFVRDYANKPGFPKPIVDLASGRLWLRSEVEDFLRAKSGKAGAEVSERLRERFQPKRKPSSQTRGRLRTRSLSVRNSRANASIRLKYQQPANDKDFEILCLRILRRHWNCASLELYGHRGEQQYGIDILDVSGSADLRAAQCRLHEPWKTIPPTELQKAVQEARKFVPRLQLYVIMTTARASTVAQNTVLQINREHQHRKLFTVKLMTWEEIEILLDEYGDARDLSCGIVEESNASFPRISMGTRVLVDQFVEPSANSIDADIEEAKAYLVRREYQLARLLLQRTRNQKWDVLSARQRFRILSNIAAAYVSEGKPKEAIPLFLEAKTHQPQDEVAIANEVLAFVLANDQERAFALAAEARHKVPHSGPILSYWIRSAPAGMDLANLQMEVPSTLQADPNVCVALAERALNALSFADAERFSRIATEGNKDWPYPRLLLAQAVIREELLKSAGVEASSALALERLRSSEQDLTRIIEQADAEWARDVRAEALLVRAQAKRLRGQRDAADDDVIAAHEALPTDPTVLREYAQVLLKRGERHDAIAELREAVATSGHREDVTVILATTLRAGGDSAERNEALRLFMKLAAGRSPQPEGFREHIIWATLEALAEEGQLENAESALAAVPEHSISPTAVCVFQSKVALLRNNRDQAVLQADRALGTVAPSTRPEDVRLLGLLLSELGRHKDALPIWQRLASRNLLTTDTRRLIDCAARLGRDDVILEVCGDLRRAGVEDPELVSYEASILQPYDPEGAASVLQRYVAKHPEDRAARLHLSALGLQLHKEDLVAVAKEAIPTPSEVPSRNWPLVVRVMAEVSSPENVLRYAYKLLREQFSEPDAHRAYLAALLPMEHRPDIPQPKHAGPGTAVSFVEDGTDQEHWCVIEEEYEPDGKLNEVSPKHFLASQLKGRREGDKFVLSKGAATERMATIRQILSKYVYRYQDCLMQWQIRFPSVPGIEMVRVTRRAASTGAEEMDIGSIYSLLDKRESSTTELLDIYARTPVPLHTLGTALGNNAFETVCRLALKPNVKIKCCSGSIPERTQAHEAIKTARALVLELTSIATLAVTDLLSVLENPPMPVIVSRGTLSELEDLADEKAPNPDYVGMLGKHEGRYVMVEDSVEQRQARVHHLKQLVSVIKKSCQMATAPSLAALDPEKRAAMIKMLGHHGAESVVLASEPGRVLWTDDFVLSALAQNEFGARRAWTQIYLQALAETGAIDAKVFFEGSAKLAAYGYYFTSLNSKILMAARSMAHADPGVWPLKQCLETLEDEAISSRDLLGLVTPFIVEVYREGIAGQESVFVCILEHLRKRTDGVSVVRTLRQLLPGMFGVNALAAQATDKTMRVWARALGLTTALKLP